MGSIKHRKTSTVPNALNDTRRIGGDDWNNEHDIDLEVSDVAGLEARLIPVDQVVQYRDDALAYRNEAAGSAAVASAAAEEAAATLADRPTFAQIAEPTFAAEIGTPAGPVQTVLDSQTFGRLFAEGSVNIGSYLSSNAVERFKRLGARASKPCVINRLSATSLALMRALGGPFWEIATLTTGGIASGPYSWNDTEIREVFRYVTSADPAIVYAGSWLTFGSSDPLTYVGGAVKQASAPAGTQTATATVTLSGTADLYVVFTGRTAGSYFKVELNGDTNAANLLPSNGTYRYIDTYTSVNLQYKQAVMIASGVPAGVHTIKLTATTDKNPSSTGTAMANLEAIAICGTGDGLPGDAGTDAPRWLASTAYLQYAQVRTSAGRYYSCSVAGTTSTTEPTHTSGTATDGTVTWTFMASSSYAGRSQHIQAAGSQLEYAYTIKPQGATVFEDVGGILHGNEELLSLSLALDGVRISDLAVGAFAKGSSIQVAQSIKVTHSQTGSTAINLPTLRHNITADDLNVTHEHNWQVAAVFGYFYNAMWPLLHWYTVESRYAFTHLWTPQAGEKAATSYYGQVNPFIGKSPDFVIAAKGQVLMPKGAGGVPSSTPADYSILAWLSVDAKSVNSFASANSLRATMAMNVSGSTPPGFSSDVLKMYFERVSADAAVAVAAGEKWTCSASYGLRLIPTPTSNPWD